MLGASHKKKRYKIKYRFTVDHVTWTPLARLLQIFMHGCKPLVLAIVFSTTTTKYWKFIMLMIFLIMIYNRICINVDGMIKCEFVLEYTIISIVKEKEKKKEKFVYKYKYNNNNKNWFSKPNNFEYK